MLALALVAYGAWLYSRPSALNATRIRAVRVWNEPRGDRRGVAPAVDTDDPEAVAALLSVVRAGRETPTHKCGDCGVIVLRRSFGRSERLEFLPGHSPEWYELRTGLKTYQVPRAEFVATMKRLGVDVPLECK